MKFVHHRREVELYITEKFAPSQNIKGSAICGDLCKSARFCLRNFSYVLAVFLKLGTIGCRKDFVNNLVASLPHAIDLFLYDFTIDG